MRPWRDLFILKYYIYVFQVKLKISIFLTLVFVMYYLRTTHPKQHGGSVSKRLFNEASCVRMSKPYMVTHNIQHTGKP